MGELTLGTLAGEINYLHSEAERCAGQAVVFAARCGQRLLEAKAQVRHGEWLPWLSENCKVRQTQAKMYMRLAREMPELLESNRHPGGDLGIKHAVELLSAPDEVREEVTARLEAGETVSVKEIERLKREHSAREADLLGTIDGNEAIINLLRTKVMEKPKEIIREVIPQDYDHLKAKRQELEAALAKVEAEKAEAIQSGVKRYMQSLDKEIQQKEHGLEKLEQEIERYKAEIQKVTAEDRDFRAQRETIQKVNRTLASLAAEMSMFEFQPDDSLRRQWELLAGQMRDGATAIDTVLSPRLN